MEFDETTFDSGSFLRCVEFRFVARVCHDLVVDGSIPPRSSMTVPIENDTCTCSYLWPIFRMLGILIALALKRECALRWSRKIIAWYSVVTFHEEPIWQFRMMIPAAYPVSHLNSNGQKIDDD